jgi:hypothetical protein
MKCSWLSIAWWLSLPWFPTAVLLIGLLGVWLGIFGPLPSGATSWLQAWQPLLAATVASVAAHVALSNTSRSPEHAERLETTGEVANTPRYSRCCRSLCLKFLPRRSDRRGLERTCRQIRARNSASAPSYLMNAFLGHRATLSLMGCLLAVRDLAGRPDPSMPRKVALVRAIHPSNPPALSLNRSPAYSWCCELPTRP